MARIVKELAFYVDLEKCSWGVPKVRVALMEVGLFSFPRNSPKDTSKGSYCVGSPLTLGERTGSLAIPQIFCVPFSSCLTCSQLSIRKGSKEVSMGFTPYKGQSLVRAFQTLVCITLESFLDCRFSGPTPMSF